MSFTSTKQWGVDRAEVAVQDTPGFFLLSAGTSPFLGSYKSLRGGGKALETSLWSDPMTKF